ncbi:MAG: Fic family protein [Lachnospiraceae bacterium]|nr:Fic family protein [Lachnospiraceae bacterium]
MSERLLDLLLEEKRIQLKGGLYHKTQVSLAYNSNRIEGSRLTEEQTRYIYETNTILNDGEEPLKVDDILETVNHFRCFDFMLEHADEELTEELIKEFHRMIKDNTSDTKSDWFRSGDYKLRPNEVGGMQTTPPEEVKKKMETLLTEYLSKQEIAFEDVIDFHQQFESIHPFQDGNGRVGRIIMFKECLKHDIIPFIIDEQHKLYYYRGLKEYGTEKGYLLDTGRSAQDAYESFIKYFFPEQESS